MGVPCPSCGSGNPPEHRFAATAARRWTGRAFRKELYRHAAERAVLELVDKAAAAGHGGAMLALGALHAGGHDLPEDRIAAQRWFRAAAELGRGQARLVLDRYLGEGAAGEPNPTEARLWFERATAQGIEEAQADLAALPAPALQ